MASGSTGHSVPQSGIYTSTDDCKARRSLSKGETFPPCDCKKGVSWVLTTPR